VNLGDKEEALEKKNTLPLPGIEPRFVGFLARILAIISKNAIPVIHNGQFHRYQSTKCWFWPYISTFTLCRVLGPPPDRFTGDLRVLFLGRTKRLESLDVIHNFCFQKVGIFEVSCWKVWGSFFPHFWQTNIALLQDWTNLEYLTNFLGYVVTWSNTHHIIVPPAAA